MGTQTSVKHARSWRQACTMRRFLMMTDAETALASSWQAWQLRPDQRSLVRPVVPAAEAEQGVAPVIVMPAVPKTDRRRYVTKKNLVKYEYTGECQACTQLASGMHQCAGSSRRQIALASSWRVVQVERVTARTVSTPRLEAGEEMDVCEPSVQPQQPVPQSVSQPFPIVRVGGSSSSGTRA